MQVVPLALVVLVGPLLAGCGSGGDDPAAPKVNQAPTRASGETATFSQTTGVPGKRRFRVLTLPRIGEVLVSCPSHRLGVVIFRADRLMPTANLVVAQGGRTSDAVVQPSQNYSPRLPHRLPLLQHWILGTQSEVARIVDLTIGIKPGQPGYAESCDATAQATVDGIGP